MSPRNIAAEAHRKKLDILGICDHNSAENAGALMEAAGRVEVRALPGLEITSREEVHMVALFDEIDAALSLQEKIYANLPGQNDEKTFGLQVVASSTDEVLGFNPRLLIGATTLSLEDVVVLIHSFGGLAIAAHVDREGFSLFGQLGFIPDGLKLDALEISPRIPFEEARNRFGFPSPLIVSSDAHILSDIGLASTSFRLESASAAEIKMALVEFGGRAIIH